MSILTLKPYKNQIYYIIFSNIIINRNISLIAEFFRLHVSQWIGSIKSISPPNSGYFFNVRVRPITIVQFTPIYNIGFTEIPVLKIINIDTDCCLRNIIEASIWLTTVAETDTFLPLIKFQIFMSNLRVNWLCVTLT